MSDYTTTRITHEDLIVLNAIKAEYRRQGKTPPLMQELIHHYMIAHPEYKSAWDNVQQGGWVQLGKKEK